MSKTQRCRECGCTNHTPCVDEQGHACYWVEPDLCSACAPPRVELYTEAQAAATIRLLRQGHA